jgi:hypothetical protein
MRWPGQVPLLRASRDWRTFARVAGLRDRLGSRPATAFTLLAVRRAAVLVWVFFFFALRAIVTISPSRAPRRQRVGWLDHGPRICPNSAAAALLCGFRKNSFDHIPFPGARTASFKHGTRLLLGHYPNELTPFCVTEHDFSEL